MKVNARRRGLQWSLSDEIARDIMSRDCVYCGDPPGNVYRANRHNGSCLYSGIDRIDSKRGYEDGNVAACCRRCNTAKSDRDVQEFKDWAIRVAVRSVQGQRLGLSGKDDHCD
jgi:hypothetical protein